MNKRIRALLLAATIGLIIVAIFLGFLTSLTNPVSWILIGVLAIIPFVYNKRADKNLLVWQEQYSVGVKVLDDDHKKLIDLLNQFKTAYDYHTSEAFEKEALEALVDYTKFHFAREEKLLEQNNYPDFAAHKLQHQKMIAEVEHFVQKYHEQGHDALAEVGDFLSAWLINHINGTDRQYSQHLNDHGIA